VSHNTRVYFAAGAARFSHPPPKGWSEAQRRFILPRIISRSLLTRLRGLSARPTQSLTIIPVQEPASTQLKLWSTI